MDSYTVQLYNEPIKKLLCEYLVDLVRTRKVPTDIPSKLNECLAKIAMWLIVHGREKTIDKLYSHLNNTKVGKSYRYLIRKYIFSCDNEEREDQKIKVPFGKKIIENPFCKICIKFEENPFFDFQSKIPVRDIKYNFKNKSLFIQAVGSSRYSVSNSKRRRISNIDCKEKILTLNEPKMLFLFLDYKVSRFHKVYRFNWRSHNSDYNKAYCVVFNFEDQKDKKDKKESFNQRYIVLTLKKNINFDELPAITNPFDLIPLLQKNDVDKYKKFLSKIGVNDANTMKNKKTYKKLCPRI